MNKKLLGGIALIMTVVLYSYLIPNYLVENPNVTKAIIVYSFLVVLLPLMAKLFSGGSK